MLDFCGRMVLDNGEGWRPEPFQVAVLDALCRGVDVVWLEIPEGNGKTSFTAGLLLAHMFLTEAADCPAAAASRDQTGTLLRQATGIVRRSPGFEKRFRCLEGYKRIECPEAGGRFQVFAADAGTGDGVIPTLAVLEELHRHPSLELYRTWRGKLLKRDGQILIISTAGAPDSEYELAKAQAIEECDDRGTVTRDGSLLVGRMPGFEIRVHAVPAGADLDDLDVVKSANPLSAITVAKLAEKRADPTWSRDHWARFTCGRPTREASSAVSEVEWDALEREVIPEGVEVAVGCDFGWKHDTTALVPFWMPEPGRRVLGVPEVLVPPRDGTSLDPRDVRDAFVRIHERTPISLVAMDPQAGGEQFAEWLEKPPGTDVDGSPSYAWEAGHGLGVSVVTISSWSNVVNARIYAAWMEAVRTGVLRHPGDRTLTRHVLNAVAKPLGEGRYRFDRPRSSRSATFQDVRVIDALVAAAGVHWQQTADLAAQPRPFSVDDYRVVMV